MNIQSLTKLPLSEALLKFLFHTSETTMNANTVTYIYAYIPIFLTVPEKTVKPTIKVLLSFILKIKNLSSYVPTF
jgi:hypothetical protein